MRDDDSRHGHKKNNVEIAPTVKLKRLRITFKINTNTEMQSVDNETMAQTVSRMAAVINSSFDRLAFLETPMADLRNEYVK